LKYQIFYFQVYGNLVEENIMYQELQNTCRKKHCRLKAFRASLGEFGQNILRIPHKLPGLTPMVCYVIIVALWHVILPSCLGGDACCKAFSTFYFFESYTIGTSALNKVIRKFKKLCFFAFTTTMFRRYKMISPKI